MNRTDYILGLIGQAIQTDSTFTLVDAEPLNNWADRTIWITSTRTKFWKEGDVQFGSEEFVISCNVKAKIGENVKAEHSRTKSVIEHILRNIGIGDVTDENGAQHAVGYWDLDFIGGIVNDGKQQGEVDAIIRATFVCTNNPIY
jgi:hypothetical protein